MKLDSAVMMAGLAMLLASPAAADPAVQAEAIARHHVLVDTHIDVPYRLQTDWEDLARKATRGDFDLPRARQGGLDIAFLAIYTDARLETAGGSFQAANRLIDSVEAIAARAPDQVALGRSVAEAEQAVAGGRVALAMGMENGSPLEGKLDNIRYFHDRGIRYITLVHSRSNQLADSSYDENRRWDGLSEFGRQVVREMNRQGVMVDVTHLSDEAFWQVLEISTVPVIASHSSLRHFTPGFERNMSDEMVVALAKQGGVVQIAFGSAFLTDAAHRWSEDFWALRRAFAEKNGYESGSPETEAFEAEYRRLHPFPYATLEDVLDHIERAIALVGVDHIGIGSDFDGIGDSAPEGLKDVSSYPNLVAGLLGRGHSTEDVAKIMGGNLLRVWRQAEAHAETSERSSVGK